MLVVDTDVTFFRNPLEVLQGLPPEMRVADVAALDDTGPGRPHGFKTGGIVYSRYLNCGFLLLRNTAATRVLARQFRTALAARRGINDQAVFNDVLWPLAQRRELHAEALPPARFLNGYRFYEARCAHPINASAIVAVHHNWVRGDERKWARATDYQTLVTNQSETRGSFWKRAKWAFTALGPWN